MTTIKGKLELIAERVWLHLKQSELAKAEADIRLLTELSGNDIKIFAAPKSALLIRQGRKAEAGQLLDRVMGILRAEKADAAVIEEWQKLKNELMAYVR